MKATIRNFTQREILGGGDCSADREILSATIKQWWQKLGYCSIFAAVPAMLTSQVAKARSHEAKKPEASVAGQVARRLKLNMTYSNPPLLKRQSEFRLPHQRGSFNMLAMLGGNDDCPGRPIPGGNYPAVSPYVDTGDTTGANDTVTRVYYINYHYYNWDAFGPDHVYSFILTARGPNPKIEVTTTSSTYKPLIYVLQGGIPEGCPSATANHAFNDLLISDSRWGAGSTAIFEQGSVNFLPLNVPLYLFVDSAANDASGSGTYTLKMQDVTIGPAASPNPIDSAEFFVRQHYLDFLAREPEQSGIDAWLRVLRDCPAGDEQCLHQARLTTSASFFGSPEFRLKGYFVFRFYRTAFGRLPTYNEIAADMSGLSGPTPTEVYQRKATFTDAFVQRSEFVNNFSAHTNLGYVTTLLNRYGLTAVTAPDPAQPNGEAKVTLTSSELVSRLDGATLTRAQVLRIIADSDHVSDVEFKPAFVATQYYGYLRRTPESGGFQAWLNYLTAHPQDFREMVRGFVDSVEYRTRFGTP